VRILGLSALYHDSAAALIIDGRIVAANTVVPVLWLALHKDEIREAWG